MFYDYPMSDLLALMGKKKAERKYLENICRLMSVREDGTNMAVNELTAESLKHAWAKSEEHQKNYNAIERCFCLIEDYAKEVMVMKDDEPRIKFDELLRWRELTRLTGEELPTLTYLARHDEADRTAFCWKDVLDTDNDRIEDILMGGACDIHSHLNATYDTFILNWVGLMNQIIGRAGDFDKLQHPMDNPVVLRDYRFSDLYKWCVVAAKIRCCLYQTFVTKSMNEQQMIEELDVMKNLELVSYYNLAVEEVQGYIDELRFHAYDYLETGNIIDYAIDIDENHADTASPHIVHYGERKLVYSFLRAYFKGEVRKRDIIQWVYLYERIKVELRKELVQTNNKTGLANFKMYNSHKDYFSKQEKYLSDVKLKYGIQTGIEVEGTLMEGRICTDSADDVKNAKLHHSILTEEPREGHADRVSYVIHLLKCPAFHKGNRNNEAYRNNWIKEINKALKLIHSDHRFVGIDVAGSELFTRPELPSHALRYARAHGINNITYHVGEDFYDITDGLRSIDESIRFIGLNAGNRIGHGTAMGINAKTFYDGLWNELVLPKQYLLDNLVWMIKMTDLCFLMPSQKLFVESESKCAELFSEIGYKGKFSLDDYYASMMLRGDDEMEYFEEEEDELDGENKWKATAVCKHVDGINYRNNFSAQNLWNQYLNDKGVFERGNAPTLFRVTKQYIRQVERLQSAMRVIVEGKGLCVEANLTSNILISNMKRYDRHPITKFKGTSELWGNQIPVALGTDDKGVFATSLANEYALLAISMKKQKNIFGRKLSDRKIESYLRTLAQMSMKYRFTEDGIQ